MRLWSLEAGGNIANGKDGKNKNSYRKLNVRGGAGYLSDQWPYIQIRLQCQAILMRVLTLYINSMHHR